MIILQIYCMTVLLNIILIFLYFRSRSYKNSIKKTFQKIDNINNFEKIKMTKNFNKLITNKLLTISIMPVYNMFYIFVYIKIFLFYKKNRIDIITKDIIQTIITNL